MTAEKLQELKENEIIPSADCYLGNDYCAMEIEENGLSILIEYMITDCTEEVQRCSLTPPESVGDIYFECQSIYVTDKEDNVIYDDDYPFDMDFKLTY